MTCSEVTSHAVELALLLQNGCERLQSAVALLSNMKNAPEILRLCREIDTMESRADRVMRTAISTLFREEADIRQLIKLKADLRAAGNRHRSLPGRG